jgi:hypothetical protein
MPGGPSRYARHAGTSVLRSWLPVDDQRWTEILMSDYRNTDFDPLSPEDPYRRDAKMDPDVRAANAVWGWLAAAVFVVVVLAVAFGMTHQPGQVGTNTASNDVIAPAAPPAVTHMAPPAAAPQATPSMPAPPISPAPAVPAQPSGNQ